MGRLSATVRRVPVAGSISTSRRAALSATMKLPHGVWARPSGSASPSATVRSGALASSGMRSSLPAASVT
ncbi:hypothetical protein D9M68_368590 [compost metagenome]